MYCQFYGLKENPFNITADPSFFFFSQKHHEALSHLLYGVSQRKGIIVMTGEIGTGKTTVCRYFLNNLGKKVKTAFILNPQFSDFELLEAIIMDFGIRSPIRTKVSFVSGLNRFLLRESKRRNNVVLLIDEAQNLTPAQLEQVRLLSNLETQKDKLLQVVLVGQPELNRTLHLDQLSQLRQRIAVWCHIGPLSVQEVRSYIDHRLDIAGAGHRIAFTDEAIEAIWKFSRGTPRLINIVCDRALLAGYARGIGLIDVGVINITLEELNKCSIITGKSKSARLTPTLSSTVS